MLSALRWPGILRIRQPSIPSAAAAADRIYLEQHSAGQKTRSLRPISSTFINFYQLKSSFVNYYSFSCTFSHFHPLFHLFFIHIHSILSILIHFYPFSSFSLHFFSFIHFHQLSFTSSHFHPLSSTFIHFHPLSATFIYFHLIPSSFIHCHSLLDIFILFHNLSSFSQSTEYILQLQTLTWLHKSNNTFHSRAASGTGVSAGRRLGLPVHNYVTRENKIGCMVSLFDTLKQCCIT